MQSFYKKLLLALVVLSLIVVMTQSRRGDKSGSNSAEQSSPKKIKSKKRLLNSLLQTQADSQAKRKLWQSGLYDLQDTPASSWQGPFKESTTVCQIQYGITKCTIQTSQGFFSWLCNSAYYTTLAVFVKLIAVAIIGAVGVIAVTIKGS